MNLFRGWYQIVFMYKRIVLYVVESKRNGLFFMCNESSRFWV